MSALKELGRYRYVMISNVSMSKKYVASHTSHESRKSKQRPHHKHHESSSASNNGGELSYYTANTLPINFIHWESYKR